MAGEERDLTNRDDSRPVRVKVDNVKKIYNTRNGLIWQKIENETGISRIDLERDFIEELNNEE